MMPPLATADAAREGAKKDVPMKAVRSSGFGRGSEVAELVEIPGPPLPTAKEVLLEVEVAPINPSDLLYFEGRYARPPSLPASAGGGVLARVVRMGSDVHHLKMGDCVFVVHTGRSGWCERFVWPAAGLFSLPRADPVDLALVCV